jgi:hypothetical protein
MIKPKRKRRREPIRFHRGDKVVCLPVERGELPTVCLVVEQSHGLVDCRACGTGAWLRWLEEDVVPLSEYQSEIGFRWRVDDDNARRQIRGRTEAMQAGERYWTD